MAKNQVLLPCGRSEISDYQAFKSASMVSGRFINQTDQKQFEKYVLVKK